MPVPVRYRPVQSRSTYGAQREHQHRRIQMHLRAQRQAAQLQVCHTSLCHVSKIIGERVCGTLGAALCAGGAGLLWLGRMTKPRYEIWISEARGAAYVRCIKLAQCPSHRVRLIFTALSYFVTQPEPICPRRKCRDLSCSPNCIIATTVELFTQLFSTFTKD